MRGGEIKRTVNFRDGTESEGILLLNSELARSLLRLDEPEGPPLIPEMSRGNIVGTYETTNSSSPLIPLLRSEEHDTS